MAKPSTDIACILEAGGSVSMPSKKPVDELVALARIAKESGVHLTLRNTAKPIEDLIRIAKAGGAHVTIELAD